MKQNNNNNSDVRASRRENIFNECVRVVGHEKYDQVILAVQQADEREGKGEVQSYNKSASIKKRITVYILKLFSEQNLSEIFP